jgi:hypothetical protein
LEQFDGGTNTQKDLKNLEENKKIGIQRKIKNKIKIKIK